MKKVISMMTKKQALKIKKVDVALTRKRKRKNHNSNADCFNSAREIEHFFYLL